MALPVIMGPHVFNFLEITAMMREAGALRAVDDAEGLAEAVRQLFELPQDARKMGQAGLKVMQANRKAGWCVRSGFAGRIGCASKAWRSRRKSRN